MASENIPEGFEVWARSSPYLDLIGPLYVKRTDDAPVWGIRIEERHANRRGFAHGGLLTTLADIALGHTAAMSREPPALAVTVNLSTDFAGSAKVGDESRSGSMGAAFGDSHRTGSALPIWCRADSRD